jgi:iron complex outermembrane receptor protein
MYVDDLNSDHTGGYTVIDLNAGHTVHISRSLKIMLSGGISNMLNKKYVTSVTVNAAGNRYFEPGPYRGIFFNMKFIFNTIQ